MSVMLRSCGMEVVCSWDSQALSLIANDAVDGQVWTRLEVAYSRLRFGPEGAVHLHS